mgnify:CR=1 FL=1
MFNQYTKVSYLPYKSSKVSYCGLEHVIFFDHIKVDMFVFSKARLILHLMLSEQLVFVEFFHTNKFPQSSIHRWKTPMCLSTSKQTIFYHFVSFDPVR